MKLPFSFPLVLTTLLTGLVFSAGNATAEEAKASPPPIPTAHSVVVPYDASKPIADQEPRQYYLAYDTFESLWKAAKEYRLSQQEAATGEPEVATEKDFILSNALYRGTASPDRLEIEGRITLLTRGKAWQKVPLPFAQVNLSKIELDGAPASYQDGAVLVEKPGRHLVTVTFEVPVPEDNASVAATWMVPPASATLLALTMDAEIAEPVINGGLPLVKASDDAGRTVFTAALGQATKLEFRRRLKSTGRGMTQPSVAVIDSHLFVTPALERLETTFHLEFSGQEENSFAIAFDSSITPVRFDIPNLATWRMAEAPADNTDGMRRLEFELTQPVRDQLTVSMVGERLIDDLTQPRNFPALGADAIRLEQRRSLLTTTDLVLKPQPGNRHRQTDFQAEEIDTAGFRPVGTFAIAGENEALPYTLAEETPERSAIADYVYQVSSGKLETIGQFQIRSPGASLLDFTVTLPTNATVQAVEGNRIKDWWRSGDSLFVRFSGDTPEVTALLVYVTETLDADANAAEVTVAPFDLPDLANDKVSGTGLVVAHMTRDTTLRFDQGRQTIREVGADEIGNDFEVLDPLERKRGFRFDREDFSGKIALTDIAPRFDTSWVMLAQAYESWLRLSVLVDLEVTRSAIDRVTFSTDATTPEFRVISPEVREVRTTEIDGRRDYQVVFQHFVTEAIDFTLETEIPHAGTGSLPDVDFPEAVRQERFLIVENQSRDRIDVQPAGLDPTVRDLLPYVPDTLGSAQLFRARPGWELTVSMEKLETSAGNEAVVLYAELSTAFRANGEEWLKAAYHIQNRSLQFLPVALPEHAELVSVTVAGNEVRADRGQVEGRNVVLIPLIQTKPGQLAYDVAIVVRNRAEISKRQDRRLDRLTRTLDDPEIVGLAVERTLWNVYLPAEHQLTEVEGNMNRVAAQENILGKLEANLSELEQLNALGRSDRVDYETWALTVSNGDAIINQIEQEAFDNGVNLGGSLQGKLDQQKVILSENRIEMPVFRNQGSADAQNGTVINIGGGMQGQEVTWGDNAGEIVDRNNRIQSKQTEQRQRLQSQVRLNDNVAIYNDFFNAEVVANRSDEHSLIPKKKGEAQATEQNQQVDKLATAGESKRKEVEQKLEALNYAQIGHGGMDAQTQSESQGNAGSSAYITLEKSKASANQAPPAPVAAPAAAAKSESSKKSQSFFGRNARQKMTVQEDDAQNQMPAITSAPSPSDPFGNTGGMADRSRGSAQFGFDVSANTSANTNDLDIAFRAEGRRAVAIDFPIEGAAYHFQKLKDHAELRIESREPADLERSKWLLWLAVCLGLVALGEQLRRRAVTRFSH